MSVEKVVEVNDGQEVVLNRETGEKRKRRHFKDVGIDSHGTKIILPEGMETSQAIEWLRKKQEQEEEMMSPNIPISCFPFDGLVAFGKALKEVFGYAAYKPIRGFFGPTPPKFVSVPTSPTETVECPIGEINIPGIEGHLRLTAGVHNKKPCLIIGGEVKNKDFPKVKQLAEKTKEIVGRIPPDAEAAVRLLRLYAATTSGNLIAENENISAAASTMAGAPASMVREVVERAKLAAIGRTGSAEAITGQDLAVAANNIQDHLKLMKGAPVEVQVNPAIAAVGKSLGKGLAAGFIGDNGQNVIGQFREEVANHLNRLRTDTEQPSLTAPDECDS